MSEAPYITIYKDKWNAIRSIKAISERERQKLAAAMLDYACVGIEPEGLSNISQGMFEAIKSSLITRSKGGQPGNQNAAKNKSEKTNNKTNTENEQEKRIPETIKQTNCTDTETDTETYTDNPPKPPRGETGGAFDIFWEIYPKKVGKQDARRSYERATKGKGPDFKNKILKALEDQKKSEQWTREGGRFVPNPATWLNQGRWDDQLEPAAPEPPKRYEPEGIEVCPLCGSHDITSRLDYAICKGCGKGLNWNYKTGEWQEEQPWE